MGGRLFKGVFLDSRTKPLATQPGRFWACAPRACTAVAPRHSYGALSPGCRAGSLCIPRGHGRRHRSGPVPREEVPSHDVTAVRAEGLASAPARVVRREEDRRRGHLLRKPQSPQREDGALLSADLLSEGADEHRLDRSRRRDRRVARADRAHGPRTRGVEGDAVTWTAAIRARSLSLDGRPIDLSNGK
jgi:hypothetical protein